MITQERLKELFDYNPETGLFIRKVRLGGRASVGKVVGSLTEKGYLKVYIEGKNYFLHRLAFLFMTGCSPKYEIDHINNNRSDNSWKNLREVLPYENALNRLTYKDSRSGMKGVTWNEKYQYWQARITVNGVCKSLGCYKEKQDAITVMLTARLELHGLFAKH